jgi:hypothetical protein
MCKWIAEYTGGATLVEGEFSDIEKDRLSRFGLGNNWFNVMGGNFGVDGNLYEFMYDDIPLCGLCNDIVTFKDASSVLSASGVNSYIRKYNFGYRLVVSGINIQILCVLPVAAKPYFNIKLQTELNRSLKVYRNKELFKEYPGTGAKELNILL